jgi:acyl-CoA dehydrogenase
MTDQDLVSRLTEEEELFQRTVQTFFERELDGKLAAHEANGGVGPAFWAKAADAGLVGVCVPEEYGGPGATSVFNCIVSYELGKTLGFATVGANIGTDLSTNILIDGGTDEQKRRLAPRILAGAVQALALTEPDAGSDAAAIRMSARRDGDDYVLKGTKVYISNGYNADILYVVAKTDVEAGYRGMTIFLIDGPAAGLTRNKMKTMSFPAGGVGELNFDDVRVPAANIVGDIGGAAKLLSATLAVDRLQTGARALAQAEKAFELTLQYVRDRKIQKRSLFEYQNTQLRLAEIKIDIDVGLTVYYDGLRKLRNGAYDPIDAAVAKVWLTEMSARALDACVQLHGGAGFMDLMPISRLYTSNRQFRIVAGTSELLKLGIAKKL